MRTRIGWMVLILSAVASSSQAGLFGGRKNLPQAVDSPIVRPKLKEGHKVGASTSRLEKGKYASPTWGARWDQLFFHLPTRPLAPHLRD